jgi:transcription elongation factor GreB
MRTRYMTKKGFEAIQAELHHLWHVERPDVVDQVHEAAALGDRSENAEYIYGKRRLRQIDSRMRYLQKKVEGVTVVDTDAQPRFPDVRFGCQVTVVDDDGDEKVYRLVDADESDATAGRISVQSPIGRALMGKREGDCFEIPLPKGAVTLEVIKVHYGPGEP